MKESSKVTLLYSDLLRRNHPKLFEKAVTLMKQGKINLKNYRDAIKSKEEVFDLIHKVDDLEDIVQATKFRQLQDEPMSVLVYMIKTNAEDVLKSGICTGRYHGRPYYCCLSKEIENVLDKILDGCGNEDEGDPDQPEKDFLEMCKRI